MSSTVEYVGNWSLKAPWGTIPVYADLCMPTDKLYVIGIPEEEPSAFLVSFTGQPLLVKNFRKIRKIGLVHPGWQEQERLTLIDFTEHESE